MMKSLEQQCLDFWRSKPADEEYDYTHSPTCAMTVFIVESGIGTPSTHWEYVRGESRPCWEDAHGEAHVYPAAMNSAANGYGEPMTFGAAADRLEKRLAAVDVERIRNCSGSPRRSAMPGRLNTDGSTRTASVDGSPKGRDAQRLDAKHDSAVGEAETPND